MYMAWCWSSSWWTSISGAPSPLLQLHKGSSRRAEWQNSRRLILSRPSRRTPTRRLSDAASAKASLLNHHYQFHICIAEIQRSMYARKSEGKELRRGRSLDNRTVSSSFGRGSTTIIFTLKNEVGGLIKALKLFQVRFHFLYVDTDMVFSEDACDWPGMNVIRSFYSIFFGCVCVCVCLCVCVRRKNTSTSSTSSPGSPNEGIQTLRSLWTATPTTSSSRSSPSCSGSTRTSWRSRRSTAPLYPRTVHLVVLWLNSSCDRNELFHRSACVLTVFQMCPVCRGSPRRSQTWTCVQTGFWCTALNLMQIIRYVRHRTELWNVAWTR